MNKLAVAIPASVLILGIAGCAQLDQSIADCNNLIEEIIELSEKGFYLSAALLPAGHSTRFVLVDKERRIRGFYDGTNIEEMNKIISDIKILLDSYKKS